MTKKADIPMVTLAEHCIVCGEVFAKKHPKDNRCICEKCCDKIARLIGAKDGRYRADKI